MPSLLTGLALSAAFGCAPLERQLQFTTTGAAHPREEARVRQAYEGTHGRPMDEATEQVIVLLDSLPEGLAREGDVISVQPGYGHRIIGRFELVPSLGFFPGYQQDWRRSYCHPQQLLLVGTLFVWALVPLYYPCFSTTHTSKVALVDEMKRLARQAGGDLVVASYLWQEDDQATGAVGFVVASDPRARSQPPSALGPPWSAAPCAEPAASESVEPRAADEGDGGGEESSGQTQGAEPPAE